MAKIVAHSRASRDPAEFTLAPVDAISSLMEKTGWSASDVDLWEINEAFAMVTMLAMQAHGLDPEKVNVHGGACAQGHPIGSHALGSSSPYARHAPLWQGQGCSCAVHWRWRGDCCCH